MKISFKNINTEKDIIQFSNQRIKTQFGNTEKLDRKIHEYTFRATEV
jgi:hypothetical protein